MVSALFSMNLKAGITEIVLPFDSLVSSLSRDTANALLMSNLFMNARSPCRLVLPYLISRGTVFPLVKTESTSFLYGSLQKNSALNWLIKAHSKILDFDDSSFLKSRSTETIVG